MARLFVMGFGLLGLLIFIFTVLLLPRGPSETALAECAKETTELQTRARAVYVQIESRDVLQAGSSFEFRWRSGARFPAKAPVFVVLAVSGEVRAAALKDRKSPNEEMRSDDPRRQLFMPGAVVLPSPARAPLGIGFGAGKSRVFVPLHQPGSQLEGAMGVRLFDAKATDVEASVVGYTRCGEQLLTAVQSRTIAVLPGVPTVVVQNPYEVDEPRRVLVSNSGRYRMHIHDGRYTIYETKSGAKVIDGVGHSPNYSPTERFVIANDRGGSGRGFEVIDLVSREIVFGLDGTVLGWTHGDAFLMAGTDRQSRVDIFATLAHSENGSEKWAANLPGLGPYGNFASSWGTVGFNLDLDNGVVVSSTELDRQDRRIGYELATGRK